MIGTALNLGAMLLNLAKFAMPENKDVDSAGRIIDTARHSYNVLNTTSISQSANRAVIAPMVGVDSTILHQEYMSDVMQVVQLRDIISVLTHLNLQGSVGMGVKIENLLGSIQPNRGGMMAYLGCEAYTDGPKATSNKNPDGTFKNPTQSSDGASKDLMEYGPLAVGKVVQAEVYNEHGNKVTFPLTFRQSPVPINLKDLELIFSAAKPEDGFFARLMMVKTGEITFPEFLTGRDLIKDRFKIKNQDMSGYYKEADKRERANRAAALRTGVISMNTMANTFIMSNDTANQVELQIGKRFADPRSREKIFKSVKANTIVVCNEDRGVFTFYTNGVDMPEIYTRKDIAVKSKKDSGNTLNDLVKLLNGGM
ncbi:putative capsid and scaffold protein [Erwinia phage vB_EamM_Joad]|uniref:Putative capsid and scaffold protein n=1 Tax=Erwinia phage vB_EamM_Joad TaxID=2026081 RepID=A0A223LIQ0_9CAUD|nr:putative capsid and scaffold protein [Erwinia phage vB_EamM_Joad]